MNVGEEETAFMAGQHFGNHVGKEVIVSMVIWKLYGLSNFKTMILSKLQDGSMGGFLAFSRALKFFYANHK